MRKQKVYIAVVILLFFAIIGTAIFFITKDKKIETLQAQVDSFTGETNMTPEEVLEMRTRLETLEKQKLLPLLS